MNTKLIKKNDIFILVFILAVSVGMILFFKFSNNGLKAIITVNGNVISETDLSSVDKSYLIKTNTDPETVITFEKNCIYFSSSGCDNKLCISSGKLTSKGAVAVCLPAKVVISIEADNSVDAVTY